jgi:hypothetical protein
VRTIYLQAHLGGDRQAVSFDARPTGAKQTTALQHLPDDRGTPLIVTDLSVVTAAEHITVAERAALS